MHVYLTDRQPISKSYTLTDAGKRMADAARKAAPVTPPASAWDRIEAIAKRKVQTGEAPTLAQGIDLAVQELPHLYAQYEAERTALPPAAAPVAKQYGAAWDAIVAYADAIVAKSQTPITQQAAVVQVIEQHPELYAQYTAERR